MSGLIVSIPLIRVQNVSRTFDGGGTFAVKDLSLDVHPGETLVIVGESGSGKTTMIKMVNRLIEPSAGMILLEGEDTSTMNLVELRRKIGYVLQDVGLFPHWSVFDNVATIPRLKGWRPPDIDARVDELLALVGLPPGEFRDRMPAGLSGGQKQRVGFARALAGRPAILLMDEPFGALDPITRDALQREFQDLRRELRLTVVMVTHDMMEALLLGDRIVVMRQGALIEQGTPSALLR
jgi:osmoprotectant transport system ATP-binding protein